MSCHIIYVEVFSTDWCFKGSHVLGIDIHASQVAYHTPPRFPIDVIRSIRGGASLLFQKLGLHDFARIDGWYIPSSIGLSLNTNGRYGKTESGVIIFSDINLVREFSFFYIVLVFLVNYPLIVHLSPVNVPD